MEQKDIIESESNLKSKKIIDWSQIISGVIIGAILGVGGAFYLQVP